MSIKTTMGKIVSSVKSVRTRAILSLGIVLGLTSVSTLAYWTDSASLASGAIQTGRLNLTLDGSENLTSQSGKLAIQTMIPGESVAASVKVERASNSIPFTYTATAQATGDAELVAALRFKVYAGDENASAPANGLRNQTCANESTQQPIFGGTDGASLATLTSLFNQPRATLATPTQVQSAVLTDTLCIRAILPIGTNNGAQNKTAAVNFTFTATQLGAP